MAILQHLTPLLQSRAFDGPEHQENHQQILGLIIKHARAAAETIDSTRQLYSTRYLMPLIPFCVVHIGDALIRYSPQDPPGTQVVEFVLSVLQEASPGFSICGPLQELFRRTAVECNVELPENVEEMTGNLGNYSIDDILDACTRLDYKQPTDQAVRHMDENIAKEWESCWQQIVENPERPEALPAMRERRDTGKQMHIETLLN